MPFVKLDCGILDSTLWVDRTAREIFVTALLMAEPFDLETPVEQLAVRTLEETGFVVPLGPYGRVEAAGLGIIRRAGVDDIEEGLDALERLGAPESDSRSPAFEGRRLVRVGGGYLILNYERYRSRDYGAGERSQRYRQRQIARQEAKEFSETWEQIVAFYKGLCAYCEKRPWTDIDHVIPTSMGGPHLPSNVVPACKSCNSSKRAEIWEPARRHPFMDVTRDRHTKTRDVTQVEVEVEVEVDKPSIREGSALVPTRNQSIVASNVMDSLTELAQTRIAKKNLLGWQITGAFAYWVAKFAKDNSRVKLTVGRWDRLAKYITLYDLETCLYAIDGADIHPHMNQEGKTFHEFSEIFMNKPEGPDRVEKLSEYARKRDKREKHRLFEKYPELEGK